MSELTLVEEDTLPKATDTLDTSDSPSSGTVTLIVENPRSGQLIANDAGTIVDDTAGATQVEYQFSDSQTANIGRFHYRWVIDYQDGDTESFPKGDPGTVEFTAQLNRGGTPVSPDTSKQLGPYDILLLNEQASAPSPPGANDWGLYFNSDGQMMRIDESGDASPVSIDRGPIINRPASGDYDNQFYFATDSDERTLYRWDESGSSWVAELVAPENIAPGDLGFDPVTQAELDAHEADADAHHEEEYTDERVRDVVGALLSAGDKLSWTANDEGDILTVNTTALDQEEVEDVVESLVTADSNLSYNYDGENGTLKIGLAENVSVTQISAEGLVLEDTLHLVIHSDELIFLTSIESYQAIEWAESGRLVIEDGAGIELTEASL